MRVFSACERTAVQYLHAHIKVSNALKSSPITFQGQELLELLIPSNKTVGA